MFMVPRRHTHPSQKSELFRDWYPILLITMFNVCDLTGKCLPFGKLAPSPRTLLAASLSRVVFVPAFWAAGVYAGDWVWLMLLLTTALGLSNGLLTALLMTLAPQSVEGREAGLVENMLVFSLVAGLTVGAVAGWLWLL
jgi:equilibrative nucleoside transporter 1/2/3